MIDYKSIIEKYKTPTYVYDIDTLNDRVDYIRNMLNKYNLVYAVKANTFVIKEIDNKVDRFEICSTGEYNICERLGINPRKMVISGVNKDRNFIENLISNDKKILLYTIESYTQYELLNELSTKYKRNINVLIRLTSGNQFGVNEEILKRIIKENNNNYLTIDGIEYFSGTQKHSLKRIEKEIDYLNNIVEEIENDLNFSLKEIEYGPGLPIFYFKDDVFDEKSFLIELNNLLLKLNKKVSLEIGRSLVASCGSYLTSVVDIKDNKNGNFIILDGGINHLVYYGQTMAMKIPYYETIPKREGDNETYNLCGSLCTINDILVKNIQEPKLELNDVFIFKNVGAYSSTEGISLFLSRDLPKVVIHSKDKNILVRDTIKTDEINYPKY